MSSSLLKGLAIQAEYASKRARALNKRDEDKIRLVKDRIEKLAATNNVKLVPRGGIEGWEVIYDVIIDRLQRANLTINLEAESWFTNANTYETYATTYQKNVKEVGGVRVLPSQYRPDGSESEAANQRLSADDKVTVPEKWKDASRLHPQSRRLYKAMSAVGGKHETTLKELDIGNNKVAFAIDNQKFNPNSRQVFAGLNYGRRLFGSNTQYGHSHVVLKSFLKQKAIYFPGDTFNVSKKKNATETQCTFQTLGAVLAYCPKAMSDDIWAACFSNAILGETDSANLLLEAHIFEEVRMDRCVEELVLSRQTSHGDLAQPLWNDIKNNAREWCKRNNVRMMLLSA